MGHGGFRVLVLAPSTVQEAIDLTYKAFGLAAKYQNPTVVLMDGWIGSMKEPVTLPEAKEPVKNAYTGWGARYYNPSGTDVDVVTSCLLEPDRQELLNIHFGEMYDTWARDEVMAERVYARRRRMRDCRLRYRGPRGPHRDRLSARKGRKGGNASPRSPSTPFRTMR